MNFSNSTTDKTERLKGKNTLASQWESIDWTQVQKDVNRLQTRIAKATVKGDKNKVKRLQYLLTHSFCAKSCESGDGSLTHDLSKASQLYQLGRPLINLKLHELSYCRLRRKRANKKINIYDQLL